MSLRAFHILFILLSVILCVVCSYWAFATGAGFYFGIGSALSGVILTVYGVRFVSKTRGVIR